VTDLRELRRLEPLFWRAPSAHNTQPWLLEYSAERIALGVDAENPTGATQLYERAGMHVAYEAVTYGKDLT